MPTGQNPNFIETLGLVDAGLGLGFDSFKLNAMRFEAHHQKAKQFARQGMGIPVKDVHDFHTRLVEKATIAMDMELHTLGRIPPSRELRERFTQVPQGVFDVRYHERMLRRTHGSRAASSVPPLAVDIHASPR